jgi:hypothetical protein
MVRVVFWVLFVAAGLGCFSASFINPQATPPFLIGVLVVVAWIGFANLSSWLYSVARQIHRHLGTPPKTWHAVSHTVHAGDRINVQTAVNHLQERASVGPVGLVEAQHELGVPDTTWMRPSAEPQPITSEGLPLPGGGTLACSSNALHLLRHGGEPFALLLRANALQIAARSSPAAEAALAEVLRLAQAHSPYHGAALSIDSSDRDTGDYRVRFHDIEAVPREDIILPGEVLEVLERNVIGHFRHADALRRAGQPARHGVLLHGPPGTGKTLVTRHLARAMPGVTAVLLTGRDYTHLNTACRLARAFAPSLVVLEDVDLIAAERRKNRRAPLLHELMDEMDGLGGDAAVVFLLTTNRPEVLEPALSARPGRVDQAVYFPLPDAECRRRLFAHFGRGVDTSAVAQAQLLSTEGASPAFIKELVRRVALMALERGARGEPLPLADEDFRRAMAELVRAGGELTRSFLGFPSPQA